MATNITNLGLALFIRDIRSDSLLVSYAAAFSFRFSANAIAASLTHLPFSCALTRAPNLSLLQGPLP